MPAKTGEKLRLMFKGWRRYRARRVKLASEPAVADDSATLLQSLLEKTPGAVRAQRSMDGHPHMYDENKKRLYELIDFNDTFVSLALSLRPEERTGFIERLRVAMQQYCKKVNAPMFSDEQYDAITRGLSREVAVYLGAKQQGFQVTMSSRTQDAMGVDMMITDPVSGKTLNIDCKTASSYHFRLKDLVSQGRMSEEASERAEMQGYAKEINGHDDSAVAVVLLRIDPNETGDIKDFMFTDPTLLGDKLHAIFSAA